MPKTQRIDDELHILRLETPEEISRWRAGFVGAYQTVFEDAPYHERITAEEAEGVYMRLTSVPENIFLVAVRNDAELVGFGVAIPLRYKSDASRALSGLVPTNHSFYLAELGVLRQWRDRGIGRLLIQWRIALVDRTRYSHLLLRVSASRNASYDLYRSMGFEDMGVYMEVPAMRTDGRVVTDRRLFLCSIISQIQDLRS
jgi:ribosomal protein S18 acetylase RimI-like enzyme